jgi:hypothetical protein
MKQAILHLGSQKIVMGTIVACASRPQAGWERISFENPLNRNKKICIDRLGPDVRKFNPPPGQKFARRKLRRRKGYAPGQILRPISR